MPRERTYTDAGYIEVQWAKGGLVCLVSGEKDKATGTVVETMHQFTAEDDLAIEQIVRVLKRAIRQGFKPEPKIEMATIEPLDMAALAKELRLAMQSIPAKRGVLR
jgi:adenine deaminase